MRQAVTAHAPVSYKLQITQQGYDWMVRSRSKIMEAIEGMDKHQRNACKGLKLWSFG